MCIVCIAVIVFILCIVSAVRIACILLNVGIVCKCLQLHRTLIGNKTSYLTMRWRQG